VSGQHFLFVPGPTTVPQDIMNAISAPMEDHRSLAFPELTHCVLDDLKEVFKTKSGRAFVFPASGTGGWEIALTNTLSPGDTVIASRIGHFSNLWINMCKRLGLEVIELEAEWGEAAPIERYQEQLAMDRNHRIKAALICHNETSTGVTSDVAGLRRAIDDEGHSAMLLVDGVSSIASIDFNMDAWGVDFAVACSQKGFMLPAGLAITCASEKALNAFQKKTRTPRAYFRLQDMIEANDTGYFPFTPSLPMLRGLRASLRRLLDEGLDNVFARHHRLAGGVRRGIRDGWGLDLCARQQGTKSDTVSAIMMPDGFDSNEVIRLAQLKYNLALGAGLSKVSGRLYRIGHLGDLNELMLCAALSGAEMAMRDIGIDVTPGSAVAAASEYWRSDKQ